MTDISIYHYMSVLKVQQAARTAASMHSTLHTVKPCHLLSVRQRYHKYLYSSLRRFTPTVKTGTVHQHLKIQIFKKKKDNHLPLSLDNFS